MSVSESTRWFPMAALVIAGSALAAEPAIKDRDLSQLPIHHVESNPATGSSAAVVVDQAPLVFTSQFLPVDAAGEVIRKGDAAAQAEVLLDRVAKELSRRGDEGHGGTNLDRLIKLNIYVTSDSRAAEVTQVLAARFASEYRPAVSFVTTRLPHPDALVAMDAVGLAFDKPVGGGAWLYISGQAEPGELIEATRKTLASLSATLVHHGLTDRDVVQAKCFLQPINRASEVQRAIDEHRSGLPPVAVSFVEWQSNLPIEIELVANAGDAREAGEPIEYLSAPGLNNSPLYSRVVRVNRGTQIFFSGLYGPIGGESGAEVDATFRELARLLDKTGTDLVHLAKATYYVTDNQVSTAHNEIRPRYYKADRPPAASKALVSGTGRAGASYTMDVIAASSSLGTPPSGPEQGHGLSSELAADGWISLFDGQTAFGWQGAKAQDGRLQGGISTARFGPCEIRAELVGQGKIQIGERVIESGGGAVELSYEGGRSAIELSADTQIESLVLRPAGLELLWNGHDLDGWRRIDRQAVSEGKGPTWNVEQGWNSEPKHLRVVGGPGALEFTGRQYGDCIVQLVVRSRAVHSNGGLFVRGIPGDFMNGYEAQLHNRAIDDDPGRPYTYATGGIDDRQNARRLTSRDFTPFRMTVLIDGPHIATWVNGFQTTDWTDDRPPHENPREGLRLHPGVLQIQAHDVATDYELREISAAELP